jgi:hypothetical protein
MASGTIMTSEVYPTRRAHSPSLHHGRSGRPRRPERCRRSANEVRFPSLHKCADLLGGEAAFAAMLEEAVGRLADLMGKGGFGAR